jgi:DNA-directed RNA polymerase subunit RPC12/RpoP
MTHHEAFEHHDHPEHHEPSGTCRVCSSPYSHEQNPSRFGICEKCGYKILILLVVVMVAVSYVAWFGIL